MMPDRKDRLVMVERLRSHAEELRAMSHDWRDPETLEMLQQLIRDYDRMADLLEKTKDNND